MGCIQQPRAFLNAISYHAAFSRMLRDTAIRPRCHTAMASIHALQQSRRPLARPSRNSEQTDARPSRCTNAFCSLMKHSIAATTGTDATPTVCLPPHFAFLHPLQAASHSVIIIAWGFPPTHLGRVAQPVQVPGEGGRIAGHINNAGHSQVYEVLQQARVQARAIGI